MNDLLGPVEGTPYIGGSQPGFLSVSTAGLQTSVKSNLNATVDPTSLDGGSSGYSIGSRWINTTTDKVFECVDSTVLAATWKDLSSTSNPGGSSGQFQINNAGLFDGISGSNFSLGVATLPNLAITDLTPNTLTFAGTAGRLSAVTGSSVSGANVTLGGNLDTAGFVNVDSAYSYKQGGQTILKSSATNSSAFGGVGAGQFILSTDTKCTAFGYLALSQQTGSGADSANSAFGYAALQNILGGVRNSAFGDGALKVCVAGNDNVAVGCHALLLCEGSGNIALGYNSAVSLVNGSNNVAIGLGAFPSLGAGSNNIGIGTSVGLNTTAANGTIAIGDRAVASGLSSNVGIGTISLFSTLGSNNVGIGESAGQSATGDGGVYIGYRAGQNETGAGKLYVANSNTANPLIGGDFATNAMSFAGGRWLIDSSGHLLVGTNNVYDLGASAARLRNIHAAGYTDSIGGYKQDGQTVLTSLGVNFSAFGGVGAGQFILPTDTKCTAFGHSALSQATGSGADSANSAFGYAALMNLTTGVRNSALGDGALKVCLTGNDNTAVGVHALLLCEGSGNIAMGYNAALNFATGSNNIAIGLGAFPTLVSGSNNIGIGPAVGQNMVSANGNIAIGDRAVASGSSHNIGIGTIALFSTVGSNNIGIGQSAGQNATGNGGIYIGFESGQNETGSGKLYIANSNTSTPLIGGDFTAQTLSFCGGKWLINSSGHLLPGANDTYDVGASVTAMPRTVYGSSHYAVPIVGYIGFNGSSLLNAPSNGVILLSNWSVNDFGRLQFGGTTSSFPALKRSSTTLQCRLADDSGYSPFVCGAFQSKYDDTDYFSSATASGGATTFSINGVSAIKLDNSSTAGETRLQVFDVDTGVLKRVRSAVAPPGGSKILYVDP